MKVSLSGVMAGEAACMEGEAGDIDGEAESVANPVTQVVEIARRDEKPLPIEISSVNH